jgi:hypothetical protein
MRARRWSWLACLASCGRVGFEPVEAPSSDARPSDASSTVWQFVGATGVMSSSTATVQLPLASATKAGELVVVAAQLSSGTTASVTDNASALGTYMSIPSARATYTSTPSAINEMWYGTTNAGATAVTVAANSTIDVVVAWRFTTPGAPRLDLAAALSNQGLSTAPTSPAIMTSSPGEIVIAAVLVTADVTGISSGNEFTNDELTNGNGFAHLTDPLAPAGVHIAQWDQPGNGWYCASAVAFAVGP